MTCSEKLLKIGSFLDANFGGIHGHKAMADPWSQPCQKDTYICGYSGMEQIDVINNIEWQDNV